jgi:hypothetical protein
MSEYNNCTVGSGCSYTTLSHYNSNGQLKVPVPERDQGLSGSYIVPKFGGLGYNALTHGQVGSCSGFFNITDAYGKGANNCNTKYVRSLCNGDARRPYGRNCEGTEYGSCDNPHNPHHGGLRDEVCWNGRDGKHSNCKKGGRGKCGKRGEVACSYIDLGGSAAGGRGRGRAPGPRR